MKTLILICVLPVSLMYSQEYENCEETREEVLQGEIYDYLLEDCISEVKITTNSGDTNIHGVTLMGAISSINIKPSGTNKVIIKPDGSLDFVSLMITEMPFTIVDHIDGLDDVVVVNPRTGNTPVSRKGLDGENLEFYPNPVETILTISLDNPVIYYKILNIYHTTVMEGTTPFENKINVQDLIPDMYYILVQINDTIMAGKFIKN